MNHQFIIAAIIAAIGFGTGWQIQSWRYGAKENDRANQELAQIRHNAAASIRRADNTIAAQSAATVRIAALRRDWGSARTELDRLRVQLAQPLPRAETTSGACIDRADPARELLATCAAELQDVAGAADRHASDAKTLVDAWPK